MPLPKFTIDQTTKFIRLYRAHPCLWQSDTKAYRDKAMRKKAIEEIVAEMNIPGFKFLDCQIKIKNVRSHYLQELKKIYNYNIRGVRKGHRYKPTLSWFNLIDSFLWNYIVHQSPILLSLKGNKDNIRHEPVLPIEQPQPEETQIKRESVDLDDEEGTSANSWNVDDTNPDDTEEFTAACNPVIYEESERSMDHPSSSKVLNYNHDIGYESISSEAKLLNDSSDCEFDIFGKGVAAQLKSMPIVEAVQLQLKIQQLITEHRLRLFMSQVPTISIPEPDKDHIMTD